MKRFGLLLAVVIVLVGVVGCSTTNPRPDPDVLNADAPDWVFDPSYDWDADDDPFAYFATGTARMGLNLNLAEEDAKSDALADIQQFLEVTIERLNENYAAEARDFNREDSLTSVVNNEMFTREVISGTLSGARVVGKYFDQDYFWLRMKYDMEDSFLGEYQKSLASRLRDKTRELTKLDKDNMRAELERVVKERNAAAEK